MRKQLIKIDDIQLPVYSLNSIVVGSGASGLNAADRLFAYGQEDIAIVTEGMNKGTSRNTGSDKQTYYKLTLAGKKRDSVYDMAKTLYNCGAMDGDIALVEAALSAQSFYHLVEIGVPFPHNRFGEYVGYKTDHDPRQRATSAGPLTSKLMTEKLEKQVRQKKIKIFDGYQVIGILTSNNKSGSKNAVGLITLNLNSLDNRNNRYALFNATNIIYATGGPAGIYDSSVYPESQTGSSGLAFEAGIIGKNLTESQYGIASTKFRWNLSGTYQQVLPRYVSTDQKGNNEKEFLKEYFKEPGKMLDAIFLKGYQWPFDPRKAKDYGSSLIDILVYYETVVKGRKVFLDYMHNSSWGSHKGKLDFSLLGEESYQYLKNSGALFGTPYERLAHMNKPAIELYKNHGIDLSNEYLEIMVCAQHNNGGLYGDIWWESNVRHFFPVGEVNGSHGIYRPGGTALNSGQVGSSRAAQYIVTNYQQKPLDVQEFIDVAGKKIKTKIKLGETFVSNMCENDNVLKIRKEIGKRMSKIGAHIRSAEEVAKGAKKAWEQFKSLKESTRISNISELKLAFQNYDLLLTQYIYLSAIRDYIEHGGESRGSYLIYDSNGELPLDVLPEKFRFSISDGELSDKYQKVLFYQGKCIFEWEQVNKIPEEDQWFEDVWNKYLNDDVIK